MFSTARLLSFSTIGHAAFRDLICVTFIVSVLYQKFFDRVGKVILSGSRTSEAHR